jgi:hypothetical protein
VLQIAGVGDFNGDGKADMLLRTSEGSLQTWVGSASGAILSPMEKLWADSVQAARDLMNEMTVRTIQANITAAQIAAHSGGAPTPPTWSMAGQLSAAIGDAWYLATLHDNTSSTSNIFNVIVGGSDPTFQLLSADDTSVSLSFGDDFDSMTLIDSVANLFSIAIDGISLIADWISGLPSGPVVNPGDIVVTGVRPTGSTVSPDPALYQPSGYFYFDALASGFNFNDGFGGGGGGPAPHSYVPGKYGRNQGELNVGLPIVSAHGNGNGTTTYVFSDGSTYTTDPGGVIPVRDNNPGSIAYGQFAIEHGAIGRDGNFAIFRSPADGFNAEIALCDKVNAQGYADTGLANTPANWQLAQTYAPASNLYINSWNGDITIKWTPGQATIADIIINNTPFNANPTAQYINQVSGGLGVNYNTPFSSLTTGPGGGRAIFLQQIGAAEGYYGNGGI